MFELAALFDNKQQSLTKEQIAKMLSTNPKTLDAFEKAYNKASITTHEANGYMNAKTMAAAKHENIPSDVNTGDIIDRITTELIDGTKIFRYKRNNKNEHMLTCVFENTSLAAPVTPSDLAHLPEEYKPELTGNYMKTDIKEPSYKTLLMDLHEMQKTKNPIKARNLYNMFRQGLDILDLDPVTYEMLNLNKTSMGYWLPKLIPAFESDGFFSIPDTTIAKVPITMLQLTRLNYMSHTRTTLDIVDKWAQKVFELDNNKHYFIKTGTYSSKFDFRNAKITDPKEVTEIGEYLLFIHSDAISKAHYDISGNNRPVIYGMSTTNEWVVREFIEDEDDEKLTIYHGLPLHTEYRVFVDFDTKEVLGIHPYWDSEVMKRRFGHAEDSDDPNMIHDYITYTAQESKLIARYETNKDTVLQHIQSVVNKTENISGQWSLDIMQNGDKFWFIDAAIADTSAYYIETVPTNKRRIQKENWLPVIAVKDNTSHKA